MCRTSVHAGLSRRTLACIRSFEGMLVARVIGGASTAARSHTLGAEDQFAEKTIFIGTDWYNSLAGRLGVSRGLPSASSSWTSRERAVRIP